MCCSCIESCYWHLIEKRFCYDESIALYEEPRKWVEREKSNAFENMAFYDQVSLIAGRSIVTIDPLPKEPKPIEHQPIRRIRWWEDNIDERHKENETKNKQHLKPSVVPTIYESSAEDLTSSMEEVDSIITKKVSIKIHLDTKNDTNEKEQDKESSTDTKSLSNTSASQSLLNVNDPVKLRKKSLKERRMSRSLTLSIDRTLELPVIRQISMPKFYIDTPEINQTDSCILNAPSTALTSPVVPRSQFGFFDLRSIVQMENEHRSSNPHHYPAVPVHRQGSPISRLSLIKERLKSTKLKRQGSATNLPNSIHHI